MDLLSKVLLYLAEGRSHKNKFLSRDRQHDNNRTHQQVRRDAIVDTDEPHLRRLDVLSTDEHSIEDNLRSVSIQSRGRAVQKNDHSTRVVNQPYIFQPAGRKVGRTRNRPLRLTRKSQGITVRLLKTRTR